jgi:hypothetical protein
MAAGFRFPAPVPVLAFGAEPGTPPTAQPGFTSMIGFWLGGFGTPGGGPTPGVAKQNMIMYAYVGRLMGR